jgi:flagellar hook-associated protein 3 FlgL
MQGRIMISSRISKTTATQMALSNLNKSYNRLADLQDQMSSGKQLRRPSDGPADTVTTLGHRIELRRNEQLDRNASDAKGWLDTTDSTLQGTNTLLRRARDLTTQALNGATGPEARKVIAQEVRQLRDSLMATANTTFNQRPIFAGTATVSQAVNPATGAPMAAGPEFSNRVLRPLAAGETTEVNVTLAEGFGTHIGTAGGDYNGDIFEALDRLATDLDNNNVGTTGARQALTSIDNASNRVGQALAFIGARARRVDDVKSRNLLLQQQLTGQISELEDVDLAKVTVQLRSQEVAYQAALSATAKVLTPTLVDFLR